MILDVAGTDPGFELSTDICIIGAGAAGITIGLEFIDAPFDVCLLESGGMSMETDTQSLYTAKNIGLPRQPHDETRLRYFGGTTNHWTGQCAPFVEQDFISRKWVPFSGWPLTRAELAPYYSRAYGICDLDSAPFDTGLPNIPERHAPTFDQNRLHHYFLQYSLPTRFGPAYGTALERARNIRILLHANVTSIVANADARAVDRIEFRTIGGRTGHVRARHVILCCGGIENARLLLLSNGVMKAGLGNQNDVVGRYFMDHAFGRIGLAQQTGDTPLGNIFGEHQVRDRRFRLGLALASNIQQHEKVLGCGIQFWSKDEYVPAGLMDNAPQTDNFFDRMVIEFNLRWQTLKRKFRGSTPRDEFTFFDLMAVAEQAPNPQSRISLTSDRDALGLHRARIDWQLTAQDRRTREVAVQVVAAELGRLELGRVRMDNWLRDQLNWAGNVEDYHHHMGTTRMADDPKVGVVDRDCRVHRMSNFYIAGSSIFPTSSFVNPTLTIVALALRLSDHLKNALR